jgi:hypothetical protein
MKAIEGNKVLFSNISNEDNKLSDEDLSGICRKWDGEKACRYIGMIDGSFYCLNNTSLQRTIDERVESNSMVAKGNNCKGKSQSKYGKYKKEKVKGEEKRA